MPLKPGSNNIFNLHTVIYMYMAIEKLLTFINTSFLLSEKPVYKALLKNELLGTHIDRIKDSFKQDERIPGSPAERKSVLQVSV